MKIIEIAARMSTEDDCPFVGEHWYDVFVKLEDGRLFRNSFIDSEPPMIDGMMESLTEDLAHPPYLWQEIDT